MIPPTMYPHISRIYMIPTIATAVGREWARGRLDAYTRLSDHIADITIAAPEASALQFVIDAASLKQTLLRQTRATERGSSRKAEPPYNGDERKFFDLVEGISEKAMQELRKGPSSTLCRDGWAMMAGANALFPNDTGVPQFLGLDSLRAMRAALKRHSGKEPASIGFESYPDDLLGAGVATALRVYLRMEELGPQREDLVPHRLHEVDWKERTKEGVRESHALVIGTFGINPR